MEDLFEKVFRLTIEIGDTFTSTANMNAVLNCQSVIQASSIAIDQAVDGYASLSSQCCMFGAMVLCQHFMHKECDHGIMIKDCAICITSERKNISVQDS